MSPSILKTPSTMTSLPEPAASQDCKTFQTLDYYVKGPECAPGETAAIDYTGMVEPVVNRDITLPDQGGDTAHVGGVAGGEDERILAAFHLGEFMFELLMEVEGATEEGNAPGPGPVFFQCFPGSFHDGRVGGEPQIVIGGHHNHFPGLVGVAVLNDHPPFGRAGEDSSPVVKLVRGHFFHEGGERYGFGKQIAVW